MSSATTAQRVVHNRSGSNLVRGVVSAFAAQATLAGDPGGDIAVIETDEAALPEVVRLVRPRVILLNNLFRDQLDRYGELDTIAKSWKAHSGHVVTGNDRDLQRRRSGARGGRRWDSGADGCLWAYRPQARAESAAARRRCRHLFSLRRRPCLQGVVRITPRRLVLPQLRRGAPAPRRVGFRSRA